MAYNEIVIHGNQTVDYLVVLKHETIQDEIDEANAISYEPTWDDFDDTEILCTFDGDFVSSYITGLTSPLSGFIVYREKVGENRRHIVTSVSASTTSVIDYLVKNNTTYKWYVFPKTYDELGISMASAETTSNWWNWSLTSYEEIDESHEGFYIAENVWQFHMGLDAPLSSSDIIQNIDKTQIKTFSRFPKVSCGDSDYLSGSITCLLGDVNCTTQQYEDNIDLLNAWYDFVSSGKPCILKDIKGQAYLVSISDNTSKYMDDVLEQPVTISFSFIQTGTIDNISVYAFEEDEIEVS